MITDCHLHVVDPAFPMKPVRSYTPEPRRVNDVRVMMQRSGIDRVVLVQISVYGNDNSAMLHALDRLGDVARGVIHVTGDESPAELTKLHARNVRGVRLNLVSTSETELSEIRLRLRRYAELCAQVGWHIQLFALPQTILALEQDLLGLTVPVVLDHYGLLSASSRGGAEEKAVMRLLEAPHVWIKLSASYRLEGSDVRRNVDALTRDLVAASKTKTLWGSDWPHPPRHAGQPVPNPPSQPYRDVQTHRLLDRFRDGVADADLARQILVNNPARLYGWDACGG